MTDKDMIHFFVPMQRIPSATHQMKKLVVGRDGKPHTYEPPAVRETRALFMASFAKFRPDQPIMGPVALTTKWMYSPTKLHWQGPGRRPSPIRITWSRCSRTF